ncbi:MAG: ABC transporter substrate binding protein, partial [Candidatus Sulfotelmatobacter sp.]
MRRRKVLQLLASAAVATPFSAAADAPAKMARIGTLSPTLPIDEKSPGGMILLKTLQQRGYALGKNLTFEARATNGQVAKLGEAARDMKAEQIDAIVVIGFPTALACKVANVPTVVAFGCGDPVATHLIDSLARPGGVVTGISDDAAALSTKRLALIKQAVPNVRRVAMLWNRD